MTDRAPPLGGYRGSKLDGSDFTSLDLRGADFTGASLREAVFVDAQLGVSPRVGVFLYGSAIAFAVLAGASIGWALRNTMNRLGAEEWDQIAEGVILVLVLLALVGVTIWKGFDVSLRVAGIGYVTLAILAVVANLLWEEVEWIALARATVVVVFLILGIVAGVLGRVIGGYFGPRVCASSRPF